MDNASHKTSIYKSLLSHWAAQALRSPQKSRPLRLPVPQQGQVAMGFVGHATMLIGYSTMTIISDPFLGDWCGSVHRERKAGLPSSGFDDIELILITSQNADHLHIPSLKRLPRSATIVVPPGVAPQISALGFSQLIEVGTDQRIVHKGMELRTIKVKNKGEPHPGQSYVIRGDGPTVFFCGSSGYFEGFSSVRRRFRPDIAVLPIGGYCPASFRDRNMSPLDALYAFEDLGAKIMLPIRHGSFALSYEKLGEPSRWMSDLIADGNLDSHVVCLEPGQSRLFESPNDLGDSLSTGKH